MRYSPGVDIATRLKELRQEAGLTRTQLAGSRYTVAHVSLIESGRRRPSAQALSFFAKW